MIPQTDRSKHNTSTVPSEYTVNTDNIHGLDYIESSPSQSMGYKELMSRSESQPETNKLRVKYSRVIITGHVNIDSKRNKFDGLFGVMSNKVDMLIVAKTKFDK